MEQTDGASLLYLDYTGTRYEVACRIDLAVLRAEAVEQRLSRDPTVRRYTRQPMQTRTRLQEPFPVGPRRTWVADTEPHTQDDPVVLSDGHGASIRSLIDAGRLELFLASAEQGRRGWFVGEPNGQVGLEKHPLKTWPVTRPTYQAFVRRMRRKQGLTESANQD